ncbi:MAG TPA: EamA family transporter [Cyclobacteriaceae bacterium]|nr:EamA family transporter [Cyclobacteriaceae bacterium]
MKVATAIAITIVIWASAFVGIRVALKNFDPIDLAVVRFLVASLCLLIIALISKKVRIPAKKDLLLISLSGLIGITVYNVFLNLGEMTVSAPSTSFIMNIIPLITMGLSYVVFRESISLRKLVPVVICLSGVAIISFGESAFSLNVGIVYILVGAVSMSVYFIIQKKILANYSSLESVSYTIWSGTAFLLPLQHNAIAAVVNAPISATWTVIYLGIFPAALAYVLWSYAIQHNGPVKTSVFLFFVPITSIVISFVWADEMPNITALTGGAVIAFGMSMYHLPNLKKNQH